MGKMRICPNGHRYDATLSECPYCPRSGGGEKTVLDNASGGDAYGTSATLIDNSGGSDLTKTLIDDTGLPGNASGGSSRKNPRATMIMSSEEHEEAPVNMGDTRKLVGWIASFTWNSFGDSWTLREGKTLLGASPDCQIRVDDAMVSGEHAQFLFRGGKLRIRDNFSTSGTFVNGEDIEDEPRIMKDGDEIKMGTTTFKLRLV